MGCCASLQNYYVDELGKLDSRLTRALREGTIRLVSVDMLMRKAKAETDWRLPRMQDLEPGFLLEPSQAAALLQRRDRSLFVLSYGWLTKEQPDPTGHHLKALLQCFDHLASKNELPADAGLFCDFACLPQYPRTPKEANVFGAALKIMADLYSSPLGTTVMLSQEVPTEYNDRPYDARGWCVMESAASFEALVWSQHRATLKRVMQGHDWSGASPRAKVYAIFFDKAPIILPIPEQQNVDVMLARIQKATFGYDEDRDVVIELYRKIQLRVARAVRLAEGPSLAAAMNNPLPTSRSELRAYRRKEAELEVERVNKGGASRKVHPSVVNGRLRLPD